MVFAACKKILITVYFVTLLIPLEAQTTYKIRYLGSTAGLSNNSVRCVFQDSRGFMWFGTYDGLDRYDGYEFKVLRNRINDSTSLPHNYISAINEDDAGDLWIGMGQGVVKYNVFTDIVTPVYFAPYQAKRKERMSMYINSIEKDDAGNMILGTSGSGMIIKFKGADLGVQIPLTGREGNVNNNVSIQALHIDHKKNLWVFIAGLGLYRYDYNTKQLKPVNASIGFLSVTKMLTDGAGNLWLGTSTGLVKYSILKGQVVSEYTAAPGELSVNALSSLCLDKMGRLWIGTDGGGVDVLDTRTGSVSHLDQESKPTRLSSKTVHTIFIDKEQRKWIGTNKGGINIIDASVNIFNTVRSGGAYPDLSNNFITSFFEDRQSRLWIGTDGGGINVWSADRDRFTAYQAPTLSHNVISSIAQSADQNTWIATFGGGINRITPGGKVTAYKLVNVDGYENKIAIRVYNDSHDNIWATTFGNGHLYLFNKAADRFEVFGGDLGDLMSIYEDKQNDLWVGNSFQLIKIDRLNKMHEFFEIGKTVRSIYEDSKGNFWIGAEGGGLVLFDRKKRKIISRYSEKDGLSSNTLMSIVEDNFGDLWISSSNGLNRFDTETKKFNSFFESDGLQSNQFSYRAALKLRSGALAFGGDNGFNIFDPSKISVRTYFPRVVITSLKVNNKNLAESENYQTSNQGDIIQLTVPYNEAMLSFQFAALEFAAPNKIQYAYYLEGWDKDWNRSGSVRTVTYNNIREGAYRLRIKSTNAEGSWNKRETIMKIIILPPWYRTWWAYTFYALAIGGLIFLYLRYKTSQAKMKYQLQLSKINNEIRAAELESERMEKEVQRAELEKTHAEYEKEKAERETERVINEKEKEINQKRLSFFTNISHEFRTPLTMIINPVHELLSQYQGKEKEELRVIGMNATRLLSLTDQLLLFRKIEEGAGDLMIKKFDFSNLCNTVYYYFKHEAKTRKIHYEIEGINKPIELCGDKNKIEIILYNLIANAFKYVPDGGSITVRIKKSRQVIKTIIEDTGSGIPAGTGDAIFERFYQAKGHVKLGFGIGLYLVKQFTDMHKGEITYKSGLGQGTVFELKLPLGQDHFPDLFFNDDSQAEDMQVTGIAAFDREESDVAYIPEMPVLKANKAILIVDDDSEMLSYISSIFKNNYIVYKASNGRAGWEIIIDKKPDLIISDVTMPEMDGIELCKSVKNNEAVSHLPVILLTAHTSQDVELKGTEEGADYYITKPFSKSLLLARVNSLFKSRDILQQYFYDKITLKNQIGHEQKIPLEYQELLDKCIAVVEKHLDDNTFSTEKLAREMAMSHSFLYKRIKLISGQSVNSFIRFIRLRKAAEYLITTNDTVADVAYKVGFTDVKYFREQFAKLFKMRPNDYISQYRDKMSDHLRIDQS